MEGKIYVCVDRYSFFFFQKVSSCGFKTHFNTSKTNIIIIIKDTTETKLEDEQNLEQFLCN
jgi:hypothetical protein